MDFREAYSDTCSTVGIAARYGDLAQLQDMVWAGRPVDVMDNRGWRPVHEAAFNNHTGCLVFLLRQEETDINWRTFTEETPLILAAREGHVDAVHALLLYKADHTLSTNEGFTSLYEAVNANSPDCVRLLLKRGADPNFSNYLKQTPVHVAAEKGQTEILTALLNKGGRQDVQTDVGLSPVFLASQFGWVTCLKALLKAAVKRGQEGVVNLTAEDGASPLLIAAQEGHADCIELLLAHGADANITLKETKAAPVHYAIFKNRIRCLKLLLPVTSVETVHGVHPILHPYLTAIGLESPLECLQTLLSAGISVEERIVDTPDLEVHTLLAPYRHLMFEHLGYNKRCSLLCYKIRSGPYDEKVMKLLISSGLDPNPVGDELPPLIAVMLSGNKKLYCTLLFNGASPNIYHKRVCGNLSILLAMLQEVTWNTEHIPWLYICPLLLAGGETTSCFTSKSWSDLENISICSMIERRWTPLFDVTKAFRVLVFVMCLSVCCEFDEDSVQSFGVEEKRCLRRVKDSSWTLSHACRRSLVLHLSKQKRYNAKAVDTLNLPPVVKDYLFFTDYSSVGIKDGLETLSALGSLCFEN
ncbi:hypothetical protein ScPMuIL_014491 [Solemya velum]